MPYAGEVTTAINVGEIPFKVSTTGLAPEVATAPEYHESLTAKNLEADVPLRLGRDKPWKQTRCVTFVSIVADRYTYKDECGVERSGVKAEFTLGEAAKSIHLNGPLLLVSNKVQPLSQVAGIKVVIDPKMAPAAEDAVSVSITYGVSEWCPAEKPVPKPPAPEAAK